MAKDLFTDITQLALNRTLDATVVRQRAIANNIANAETPGYKRSYVPFEEELKKALDDDNSNTVRRNLTEIDPVRQRDNISASKPDGNNVNIDAEMADLSKNQLKNKAVTTLIQGKSYILRAAISEGKK